MAKILIVDDDTDVLDFAVRTLTSIRHEPIAAGSVRLAEKLLASQPFDLVLLEVILEDRGGIELIPQIKELWPDCPIIAMSAGGPRLSARQALAIAGAVGADQTLTKPFSATDLFAALYLAMAGPEARTGQASRW